MRHGTWANPNHMAVERAFWTPANIATGVAIIVAALMLVGGIFYSATAVLKNSDAFRLSMLTVKSDRAVRLALGDQIDAGWIVTGSIKMTGLRGYAELSIPVTGPANTATVFTRATRSAGVWTITSLIVEVRDAPEPFILIDENQPPVHQEIAFS